MAKVLLFMKEELHAEEKELNNEFRKIVGGFIPYFIEGEISIKEYKYTPDSEGYKKIFYENLDCEIVFTMEGQYYTQFEACRRKIFTFEWRCSSNREKLVPVDVKEIGEDIFRIDHFGILVNNH